MSDHEQQARALVRADTADDLVHRIEAVTAEIYSVKSLLFKQKELKPEDRTVDYFLIAPLQALLDRAGEPLSEARRRLAIEAYDERRKANHA